jgi:uncharacterized protein (DUF2252 family)
LTQINDCLLGTANYDPQTAQKVTQMTVVRIQKGPTVSSRKAAAVETASEQSTPVAPISSFSPPALMMPDERNDAGKRLRDKVARDAHGDWWPATGRPNPIDILMAGDVTRQPALVPLRYGRMLQSPFTFYRGSAAVMASDLAATPVTGIHVQACGDAHLMNFGGFATPERRLIFDVNDLDETLPAPWEWDVKRLAASFTLAARANGLSDDVGRNAAIACARSYRRHMRDYSDMDVMDIWYARVDDSDVLSMFADDRRALASKRIAKATKNSSSELVYPKLVDEADVNPRIRDTPPTIFHPEEARYPGYLALCRDVLAKYQETLPDDRRALFERFHLVDVAMKVVGIGSVGTMCLVALFMSMAGRPFFLQIKEANASVLEPYAGASAYSHHGQRVVMGQRLMQPASDLFLGWAIGPKGRHFYLRQLRDVKLSVLVETFDAGELTIYARLCGWVLARAHAKAGDPWTISGYLGKHDQFDQAIGKFALAYADQAEQDHAALKAAVRAGRLEVLQEA